jgi:hypothetical protein
MSELEKQLLAIGQELKLTDANKESLKLRDILNHGDLSKYLPIAISEVVRQASEPLLIANQLFTKISQKEGIYITLPAEGAMEMIDEIAPGAEYGTEEITMGGGSVIRVDIRKYGIKLSLTEEMIDQSQYDVIALWLKAAGKAFARRKNHICFRLFEKQGLTLADNKNPAASVIGRPLSGKDGTGALNYSFGSEDFFDIYASMLVEGYAPDTIVMHPLSWAIWAKDPFLKVFAWRHGGGPLIGGYDVQGVSRDSFFEGQGMAGKGARPGETSPVDFKGTPVLPAWAQIPFRVMVSPQVPFDPVNKLTSIYFVDSGNAGAIVQAEEINQHQWSDPERDIQNIKLREKYGIAILNEGRGVGVVKNVKVVPNRFAEFGVTNVNAQAADVKWSEDLTVSDKMV